MELIILETLLHQEFVLFRSDDSTKVREKFNSYLSKLREVSFFEVKTISNEPPIAINTNTVYGLYIIPELDYNSRNIPKQFIKSTDRIDF